MRVRSAAALLLLAVVASRAAEDLVVISSSGAKVVLEEQKPRLKIFPNTSSTDYVSVKFGRVAELGGTLTPLPTNYIESLADRTTQDVSTGKA